MPKKNVPHISLSLSLSYLYFLSLSSPPWPTTSPPPLQTFISFNFAPKISIKPSRKQLNPKKTLPSPHHRRLPAPCRRLAADVANFPAHALPPLDFPLPVDRVGVFVKPRHPPSSQKFSSPLILKELAKIIAPIYCKDIFVENRAKPRRKIY